MSFVNTQSGAGFTQATAAITPEAYGELVVNAVKADSIAAQSMTHASTDRDKVLYPRLLADPSTAHYLELDTIAAADPTTDEVPVTIYKTAGFNLQSRELVADSSPDTANMVAEGLKRQIIRAVDGAYLANTTAKGPNGLLSTDYSEVDTGASLTNLDTFVDAKYAAIDAGAELTNWIMSTATAKAVAKLKEASGSNRALVDFVDNQMLLAGIPVLLSNQVDTNTKAWGISRASNVFVVREGARVEVSKDSHFQSDGVALKATFRYGLGYLNEAANVRLYDAA
ncbi:phage major capsid protein [Tsukamurella sp. 8F]|uniref:phage major capsid protein n=1 Tax=unclassified Tsukamurella TaxID=2633480 RepID=UPI0023B96332|nr:MULTISPECIES: phage major capsid protein [unclassified Tsukamurella]MDF0530906.1 phage major capsid protein [Tsukamurella sp. 8J]MDF0588149.1 phage major capsid protein [Tsukamurella sp. 8F]